MSEPSEITGRGAWPTAMATVTSCRYTAGAGRAIAFGLPTIKHFIIQYNYWADGELHEGEFASEKALAQGTLFELAYNPEAPHEHDAGRSETPASAQTVRRAQIMLGLAGTVVLAMAWLLLMRGC